MKTQDVYGCLIVMAVVLLACGLMSAQDDGAPAGSIRGYDKNAASWLQEQEFAGNAPDAQGYLEPNFVSAVFSKGDWDRTYAAGCLTYTSRSKAAQVTVLLSPDKKKIETYTATAKGQNVVSCPHTLFTLTKHSIQAALLLLPQVISKSTLPLPRSRKARGNAGRRMRRAALSTRQIQEHR
jgi:hypothetical protein